MKTRHLAIAFAVLCSTITLAAAASEGRHRERHGDRGDRGEERDGDGREGGRGLAASLAAADPAYAKECGACHLAYPPSMLPAASWRAMLAGLDRHFGQNAELDAPLRARLEGWLVQEAGPGDGAAPQRITGLAWFRREHREVGAAVVARPAVRSLANCAACHQGAARWDFDEDRVRIPR